MRHDAARAGRIKGIQHLVAALHARDGLRAELGKGAGDRSDLMGWAGYILATASSRCSLRSPAAVRLWEAHHAAVNASRLSRKGWGSETEARAWEPWGLVWERGCGLARCDDVCPSERASSDRFSCSRRPRGRQNRRLLRAEQEAPPGRHVTRLATLPRVRHPEARHGPCVHLFCSTDEGHRAKRCAWQAVKLP